MCMCCYPAQSSREEGSLFSRQEGLAGRDEKLPKTPVIVKDQMEVVSCSGRKWGNETGVCVWLVFLLSSVTSTHILTSLDPHT